MNVAVDGTVTVCDDGLVVMVGEYCTVSVAGLVGVDPKVLVNTARY